VSDWAQLCSPLRIAGSGSAPLTKNSFFRFSDNISSAKVCYLCNQNLRPRPKGAHFVIFVTEIGLKISEESRQRDRVNRGPNRKPRQR
jgi:hypothetical protein